VATIIKVTIKGPDLASLIKQKNALIEKNTERELDRVSQFTQTDAMRFCPVSPDTIAHQKGTKIHMRDDIKIYAAKLLRQIGTNKFYGKFVELGTRLMRARPFLGKAFNKNYKSLISYLRSQKVN